MCQVLLYSDNSCLLSSKIQWYFALQCITEKNGSSCLSPNYNSCLVLNHNSVYNIINAKKWYDAEVRFQTQFTSSSAVAEVSCLSVVSFDSKKTSSRVLLLVTYSTDLSLRAIKCCPVVFGATLKLLVINISSSFPAINKHRRLLPAKCHNLQDGGPTASYW